jgi:hypothetical protein
MGTLVVSGVACSAQTIVAVDPYPCADAGPTGCMPGLMDGLIGFWRLNDATGSTMAHDSSTWGNHGTLAGIDAATAWVPGGPEGRSLAIAGSGSINVMRSASIDSITNRVTVAAWMYIDGTVMDYATAISRQLGDGYGQHYHLSINHEMRPALFITTDESGQVATFGTKETGEFITVPQRTWVHVAGTYDGSQSRLYLNGAEIDSHPTTGSFAAETNPLLLAGNIDPPGRTVVEPVPGRLNEVMLYKRALSAAEIARIYNGALLPPSVDGGSQ